VSKYWFARKFPVSMPNANRMEPISREGWMVVYGFAAAMVFGAVALFVAAFAFRQPAIGFIIFLICASFAMTAFILLSLQRGDKHHTVEDYKQGRVQNG
jgi:fatty acid desaturase